MKLTLLIIAASACLIAGTATAQSDCLLPHDPVADAADGQPPLENVITDPELLALIKQQELEDELTPAVVDF